MIKNIIWDFDGTLFDTYPDIVEAFQNILRNNHGIFLDDAYIERLAKVELSHCAETVGREKGIDGNSLFEEVVDFYFIKNKKMPGMFPKVEEVIEHIDQIGMNLLVTHRDRKSTHEILEFYNMTDTFREIIVMEHCYEPKPSPQSFNHLIDKYRLNRNETLGIGDRDLDVMAAVNSGIIPCYFNEKKKMHERAAYNLSSYDEFGKILIWE